MKNNLQNLSCWRSGEGVQKRRGVNVLATHISQGQGRTKVLILSCPQWVFAEAYKALFIHVQDSPSVSGVRLESLCRPPEGPLLWTRPRISLWGPCALLLLRSPLPGMLSSCSLLVPGLQTRPISKAGPEPRPLLPPRCSTLVELILIWLDSCPSNPGSFTGETLELLASPYHCFYSPIEPKTQELSHGGPVFSPGGSALQWPC